MNLDSLNFSAISVNASVYGFVFLVILLLCSALISGAEVAFFSLTQADITKVLEKKSKPFTLVDQLLKRPKKLLATILVANNFINIAVIILFANLSGLFFRDLNPVYKFWFVEINIVFFLNVVLVSFLILLFGEILPKLYASRNAITFAKFMAYPLRVLDYVFSPITLPMQTSILRIENKLGKQKTNLNVSQLSQALELTSQEDTTKQEHKMLQGIVSFGSTDTKQVMCPRIDVFALDADLGYNEVLSEIIKKSYSRIPVYQGNIDSIIGILYVKDLLPYLEQKNFDWTSLLRAPIFVPENKKLDDLMQEFQEKKTHLAVVVDEYGGTSGVISLEDVIEEIVGDISDEFDDYDTNYTKINDKNYLFEGKTTLKDFYRIIKLEEEHIFEIHKGEAETLAGFVLEISKNFPKINSKINFKNYVFTIKDLDKKRIKQLKITINDI